MNIAHPDRDELQENWQMIESRMKRLDEKIALVTGGAQGIGKAIALRLAGEGAAVALADINGDRARETAEEITALGLHASAVITDMANVDSIRSMVEQVVGEFDRIDILVNNAGVIQIKPFLEISEEDWDRVVDINQKGLFFCLQAVGAQMVRQIPEESRRAGRGDKNYGKIVNLSSISGRRGRTDQAHYAATKAAIISITQSAALALAPFNINVNAVSPSVIPTPMWEQVERERGKLPGSPPGGSMKSFIDRIPLGRAGTTEDIAAAVAFLCSSDADYVTGQTLNVDGGFEMD